MKYFNFLLVVVIFALTILSAFILTAIFPAPYGVIFSALAGYIFGYFYIPVLELIIKVNQRNTSKKCSNCGNSKRI